MFFSDRTGGQHVKREERRIARKTKRLPLVDIANLQKCVGTYVFQYRTLAINARRTTICSPPREARFKKTRRTVCSPGTEGNSRRSRHILKASYSLIEPLTRCFLTNTTEPVRIHPADAPSLRLQIRPAQSLVPGRLLSDPSVQIGSMPISVFRSNEYSQVVYWKVARALSCRQGSADGTATKYETSIIHFTTIQFIIAATRNDGYHMSYCL